LLAGILAQAAAVYQFNNNLWPCGGYYSTNHPFVYQGTQIQQAILSFNVFGAGRVSPQGQHSPALRWSTHAPGIYRFQNWPMVLVASSGPSLGNTRY
jgi:hypothetical protein